MQKLIILCMFASVCYGRPLGDFLDSIASDVGETLGNGYNTAVDWIKDQTGYGPEDLETAMSDLKNFLVETRDRGSELMDGANDNLKTALSHVQSYIDEIERFQERAAEGEQSGLAEEFKTRVRYMYDNGLRELEKLPKRAQTAFNSALSKFIVKTLPLALVLVVF